MRPRAFVLCALLALGACGSPPQAHVSPTPDAQGSEGVPNIAVTSPVNGSTVAAGNVKVKVTVTDFELVKKIGEHSDEGQGHILYYLDLGQIPTAPGASARTDGARSSHASAKPSYTWQDVEPGPHRFAVQLVNNDDTPLEPPVTSETAVTAE